MVKVGKAVSTSTTLDVRNFGIFDAHISRVQVETRYVCKIVYLDMMLVAHNHMRTRKRDAPGVGTHMDLGLRVFIIGFNGVVEFCCKATD